MVGINSLVADVDKAVPDTIGKAGKEHSLKTPVGKVNQGFTGRGGAGQRIAKKVRRVQVGFNPAKLTEKQAVGLFQGRGRPALGTLMFNKQIRAFHRTDYRKKNRAGFRCRTLNRILVLVLPRQGDRSGNKIERWESDFFRNDCIG